MLQSSNPGTEITQTPACHYILSFWWFNAKAEFFPVNISREAQGPAVTVEDEVARMKLIHSPQHVASHTARGRGASGDLRHVNACCPQPVGHIGACERQIYFAYLSCGGQAYFAYLSCESQIYFAYLSCEGQAYLARMPIASPPKCGNYLQRWKQSRSFPDYWLIG